LFGVVFRPEITPESMTAMIDGLELFGIGASWGGYESLALPTTGTIRRTLDPGLGGPAARFHIGLEDPADLIADLERAFGLLRRG
jgi:cystathionine beta-lyase